MPESDARGNAIIETLDGDDYDRIIE